MAEVYDKMENERNQLLDELDVAFQDLQEYMHRHVSVNSVLISFLFFLIHYAPFPPLCIVQIVLKN